MTNNELAKIIATDYVDFLLGGSAVDILRERRGGREAPPDLQREIALDDNISELYKTRLQTTEKTSPDSPLTQFAERLREGYARAFEAELKGAGFIPIPHSDLTYQHMCVGTHLAMKVVGEYRAECEAANISWMSLRIKADSVPNYSVCSNGAVVRYCMGDLKLLPESAGHLDDLAILTDASFKSITKSPEILYAPTKFVELPLEVGEEVAVFTWKKTVTAEDIEEGNIYRISRDAKGAPLTSSKIQNVQEERDRGTIGKPYADSLRIQADGLENAGYRVFPAKIFYASSPSLIFGSQVFFVDKGQYIVSSQGNGLQLLRPETALFKPADGTYKEIQTSDIRSMLDTTDDLRENHTGASASRNDASLYGKGKGRAPEA